MKISVVSPSIRPEGLKVIQECLADQTFQDFEWLVELSVPERGYDLNRAYNRMLRRAKGELIVSLQDYIRIPKTGLQQFWDAYQEDQRTFYTAPVGKTTDEGINWDWREHPEAEMNWQRWEIDWGAAPLVALKEIGGFDEWLDEKTWTFDGVNVGLRAELAGYKFAHLPKNKSVAWDHDRFMPHPFRSNWHPEEHNARLEEFRHGLKLDYLA